MITDENRITIIELAVRCYENNRQLVMIKGPVCKQIRELLSNMPYLEDILIVLNREEQITELDRDCASLRLEKYYLSLGQNIYSINREEYQEKLLRRAMTYELNREIIRVADEADVDFIEALDELVSIVNRMEEKDNKLYICGKEYKYDKRYILITNIDKEELDIYKEAVKAIGYESYVRYDERIYNGYGEEIDRVGDDKERNSGGYAVIVLKEKYIDKYFDIWKGVFYEIIEDIRARFYKR